MVVGEMSWVDLDLGCSIISSSCPVTQPILPNPHLPRKNLADIGMTKSVNSTSATDQHCHPAH